MAMPSALGSSDVVTGTLNCPSMRLNVGRASLPGALLRAGGVDLDLPFAPAAWLGRSAGGGCGGCDDVLGGLPEDCEWAKFIGCMPNW
eukprot:6458762-Amphidinium_carterae.1